MAGLEDVQNTVVLDREQHIAPVMRCCCDLRSPALESAIIGCRLHRSPPDNERVPRGPDGWFPRGGVRFPVW